MSRAARAPQIDLDLVEKRIIVAIAAQRDAERSAQRHEQLAASARESARGRRLEVGGLLADVRKLWPERGPNAKGWGELLKRVGLDDSTAYRYIQEARDPEGFARANGNGAASGDSIGEGGTDDESPVVDRDKWCTPKWIADAIGKFDLDPCSNERSNIVSGSSFRLDRGEDGIERAANVGRDWRVFVNPPYSDVMPWVSAYAHTRFCFLLKLDCSTGWFEFLIAHTELVLLPKRTRVEFEAPPGVETSGSNPFPHALFYAREHDASDEIRALCYALRVADGSALIKPTLRVVD